MTDFFANLKRKLAQHIDEANQEGLYVADLAFRDFSQEERRFWFNANPETRESLIRAATSLK